LSAVLVDLWKELGSKLPAGWESAELRLDVADAAQSDTAAQLLGPAQPYRLEAGALRFRAARDGSAPSADGIQRLLARLDQRGIKGTLSLTSSAVAPAPVAVATQTMVGAWQSELAKLPPDWSDALCEIELTSSDDIDRVSLLCTPLNARRDGTRAALVFRTAAKFGYGASPSMVHRCLERCDEDGIPGGVTVLRTLSDSRPVATQGPVWLVGGKTV
jgi:hypothetical protein